MRFDEYDLDNTATVLWKINLSIRNAFNSIEALKDFMRSSAYLNLAEGKHSFFGTFGFYLSSYKLPNGDIEVRSTVSPSLIREYLDNAPIYH
jgi:hypothetical protein